MEDTYFAYDNITGLVQVDVKIVNPAYKKRWLSGSAVRFYDFIFLLHSLSIGINLVFSFWRPTFVTPF